MNETRKPREFYIDGTIPWSENDFDNFKNESDVLKVKSKSIHVIEHSAYQELLEQANAMVKRLLEALEKISADFGTDHCDGNTMIAFEALAEFRGEGVEDMPGRFEFFRTIGEQ